ncbi:MAG: translation initiation factor 2 [Halobacteriaceae archaeon]
MDDGSIVTCFLRHEGRILAVQRSDGVGPSGGRWRGLSRSLAPTRGPADGQPIEVARAELDEAVGLSDACELARSGDPVHVTNTDRGIDWTVYPFLFECKTRSVCPNEALLDWAWLHPPALLDRPTGPEFWTAYRAVGPTLETVRTDETSGSATLSIRALEALRDRAGGIAAGEEAGDWAAVAELARDLRRARPAMAAPRVRIDRVMAQAAPAGTPAAIASKARVAIDRAVDADGAAAAAVAPRLADEQVLTLSRSGTVQAALEAAEPAAVLVATSRPGREGIDTAERLVDTVDCPITLVPDAAAPGRVGAVDRVLLGADAVGPAGTVYNKVGTYPLALAAGRANVPVTVVCARDKVWPTGHEPDSSEFPTAARSSVYDGSAALSVTAPLFEATPAALISDIVTDDGVVSPEAISTISDEHAALAAWIPAETQTDEPP